MFNLKYFLVKLQRFFRSLVIKLNTLIFGMMVVVSAYTPVTAQAQSEELILRMGDVSANKLPFVMAYDHGIYKKNGINVVPKFSPGAVATINKSGIYVAPENIYDPDADTPFTIAISGSAPMIVGVADRAGRAPGPIILGSTHTQARWLITTHPSITSAEQLKGKRIGYNNHGTVTHMQAILFAEAMGWDPQFDVSLIGGALGVEHLLEGHIDAMVGGEMHAIMAVVNDFPATVNLADYNLPASGSAMVADREWYKSNPVAARAFVKSGVEAIALMKTDREATYETLRKYYGMTDPHVLELLYEELLKQPSKPYPPYEGIKQVMRIYDSHQMRKFAPEFFYDDTIIRELDESGYIDSLY